MTLRKMIRATLYSMLIKQYHYHEIGEWYSISKDAIEYFLDKVISKMKEGGYLKDE